MPAVHPLQPNAERKGIIPVGWDMIAFLHIGAPAVDAADTPHSTAERYHRSAWGGQLVRVEGLAQLLGGIGNGRKSKGILILLNGQSVV